MNPGWVARAVVLLRQAVVRGDTNVGPILTNPDLDVLRTRPDFADLLWDLADMPPAGGTGPGD